MADDPPPSGYWGRLRRQKAEILNIRAEVARRRTGLESFLTRAAKALAHPLFFAAEVVFHVGWVVVNSGAVPFVSPWDPFPFPLLTGLASTQALFIGLLILMYEEREAHIGELREETDLQVSLHAERETTKLLRMMREVHEKLGVQSEETDEELQEMAQPLDPDRLRGATEDILREAEE